MKCNHDHCGVKRLIYNCIDSPWYLVVRRKYLDCQCFFYEWNYL